MPRTKRQETQPPEENMPPFRQLAPEVQCPECGRVAELEDGEPKICPTCFKKRRLANAQKFFNTKKTKIYELCGVPEEFWDADIQHCHKNIRALALDSCFLYGPRGTGKSYAATAMMKEFLLKIDNYTMPKFITAGELLLEIKASFDDKVFNEKYVVDKYTDNTHLLVLDDIGAENVTKWTIPTLGIIIDRRYRNKQPTIYTSNMTLDEISKTLGDRIASRIAGQCVPVAMNGEDRRLNNGC